MTRLPSALGLATKLGLTAVVCGLAGMVVQAAVARTAEVDLASSAAPYSAFTLRRAAEAAADRRDWPSAEKLARRSLERRPFDATALRVMGLAEADKAARAGASLDRADDLLTLAGNWDLRDDAAHIWLLRHRLSREDYASAFAHADTLLRRRVDARDATFDLLNASALSYPIAAAALVDLLRKEPNWPGAYWSKLARSAAGEDQALAATLSLGLSSGDGKLTEPELFALYAGLVTRDRLPLLSFLRRVLGRPPADLVVDGSFQTQTPPPFGWTLATAPNTRVEIHGDDSRPGEAALRVDHRGIARVTLAHQLTLLEPGTYRFRFEQRDESGRGPLDLAWRISCREGGAPLLERRLMAGAPGIWREEEATFAVPQQGCQGQKLELVTRPRDAGAVVSVWFDRLQVANLGV